MARQQKIERIIARRQPLAALIAKAQGDVRTLIGKLETLASVRDDLLLHIADARSAKQLVDLQIESLLHRLKRELEALTRLYPRFSRTSLQLLVIGRPGRVRACWNDASVVCLDARFRTGMLRTAPVLSASSITTPPDSFRA